MKPWTPTTVLQSSGPAREGGRTITANSMIPFHLYFIFFQYGPISWEKTPPCPGTRRKNCRGLWVCWPGHCQLQRSPFPTGPGRAAFCRCQITLVLYFIVAEICAEARGLKSLCRHRTKQGWVRGEGRGICYTCLQLFFFLLI